MDGRKLGPVLALLLLPLLPLWRTVALGETVGPWGHIAQCAPWNAPPDGRAWDVLQADATLQSYVWRDQVLSAWGQGEVPLWNPGAMGGIPLLANSQSGALYPPHIALGLARVPTDVATGLLAWFHLAWAGLGAALLARRLGADAWPSAAAGGFFALSPWMVAWTPLASVAATASWVPWCAALAVPTDRGRGLGWLPCAAACMLLAGHLQIAFYGLVGAATVGLAAARPGRRAGSALATAALLALGIAGAWPQLGPALEAARTGHRDRTPSAAGAAAYAASAVQPWQLAGLAHPNAFGLPGQHGIERGEGSPGLPGYWPAYVKRGDNFAESALAIGPFALACLAWARRGRWAAPAALAAVGALLALGPLSLVLYWLLPGWAASGSPGRASVLAVLGLAVAAGVGLAAAKPGTGARAPALTAACGGLVAILAVAALGPRLGAWLPAFGPVAPTIAARALVTALPGIVAGTVLAGGAAWLWSQGQRPLALALGLGAQLATGLTVVVPTGRVPTAPEGSPLTGRVAFVNEDWSLFGLVPSAAPPNTARLLGVVEAGGYDSLLPKASVLRLAEALGQDPAPAANGNMMLVKPGFDSQKLAELGVDTVAARKPLEGLGEATLWRGLHCYRLAGPGRASTPVGPAAVVKDTATVTVVRAEGPGLLTLRDANAPGWRAEVDGKPSALGPGVWRTLELGPGEHTVTFRYRPPHLGQLPLLAIPLLAAAGSLILRQNRLVESENRNADGGTDDASPDA
jgi:hypothetical protein